MKKFLSIALVLALVLSFGVTAFAANEPTVSAGDELKITKNLEVTGYENEKNQGATKYPGHALTFTTPVGSVKEGGVGSENIPALTVTANAIAEGDSSAEITVTVPDFPAVGIYTYKFKEVDPEIAGVTVNDKDITIVFTVIQDDDDNLIVAAIHCESPIAPVYLDENGDPTSETAANADKKTDEFDNSFESGALEVSKTVKGNMGDHSKSFKIKVTFTSKLEVGSTITYDGGTITPSAWEDGKASVTINLAHGASVEFDNIPAGVSYTVVELDDDGETELAANAESADKYVVTYEGATGTIPSADKASAAVTNTKTAEIDTGISLDSLPYILIVAVVLGAAVVMFVNKRRSEV